MPKDFIKLMAARFFYTIAVQIQSVTLGWQMYLLTNNAFYLGLIGLAEAIPALGLALYAGYIVDRSKPIRIYRCIIIISITSALLMLWSVSNVSGLTVNQQVLTLFLVSALTGVSRAFSQPVVFSVVPKLVARDKLSQAAAWMTSTLQIGRISGPALAGLLFAFLEPAHSVVVVSFLLCLALVPTLLMNSIPQSFRAGEDKSIRSELLAGVKFVFGHKILLPALALDMVAVLFGGVTALLPIYAAEILFVGPQGLGALRAAPAIGAVIGGLFLTSGIIKEKAGRSLLLAVAGFGVSILVFSLSSNVILSIVALALSGAFDSVSMVVRSSAVQLSSPDEMRGRISAVNSMFIGSSNELGEFESGIVASAIGVVEAAVFGSAVCLMTVMFVAFYCKTLRNLDLRSLEAVSKI